MVFLQACPELFERRKGFTFLREVSAPFYLVRPSYAVGCSVLNRPVMSLWGAFLELYLKPQLSGGRMMKMTVSQVTASTMVVAESGVKIRRLLGVFVACSQC